MKDLAYINPEVLRWARKRADVPQGFLAEKLGVDLSVVDSWESSTDPSYPTMSKAERLAGYLRIPFGYLFLPEPPTEGLSVGDFRRLPKQQRGHVSPDLQDTLNDAILKQDLYRSLLLEEGARPIPIAGHFTTNDRPAAVARYLRQALGIEAILATNPTVSAYITALAHAAESIGVLVLRSGIVKSNTNRPLSVDEFRGFALSDQITPLVFVNAQDAPRARVFTLVHELAHIAINASGISDYNAGYEPLIDDVERFCNSVAGETLAPRRSLLATWTDGSGVDSNIDRVRTRYRVSTRVALRRAFDDGKLSRAEFRVRDEAEAKRRPPKQKAEGGNIKTLLPARNSVTLTAAIVSAAINQRISNLEAARRLNVNATTIPKIAEWVNITQPIPR